MIKALAPGMRRGCLWVWISILLVCGLPQAVLAQVGKSSGATKKTSPAAKAEPKKAAPAAKDEAMVPEEGGAPIAEEAEAPKEAMVEVFKDPHAEAALRVFKSLNYRPAMPHVFTQVKTMAATVGAAADRDVIQKFVSGMANDLTDKANINALINSRGAVGGRSRAIQAASDNLLDVLQTARVAKNADFLTVYNAVLLEILPKLLDNNLISRIQAMIVLGQTGDPNAMPVYLAQLKNPNQTVWVKLWAAKGISRAVEDGAKVDLIGGAQASQAAKVLSDVLNDEKNPLPWPVQLRVLDALGAMRVSSPPNNANAEMATTAMRFLADPQARPEVRAQAAWVLGMLRVNQATPNYNYALIAYNTAQLAAELGEKINASVVPSKPLADYLANLLITPIYQAFNGMDGARDSGLLKVPGGYPTLANTRQVADLTSAVTKASVELVRSPPGQFPRYQKDLGDRVSGLKAFLEKNPPKDYHLVPKGREFRPVKEQVAKAPDDKPGGAGGPGR